jgi:hypothetical protein
MLNRVVPGDRIPIEVTITDRDGNALTALVNIALQIRRTSDDFFYDWSTDLFAASPVTRQRVLSEVSAANSPGTYKLNTAPHLNGWDTTLGPVALGYYELRVDQISGGVNAGNVPQVGTVIIEQTVFADRHMLDNTVYDANGLLTSGRLRVFATAAALAAATDGGSGQGEVATLTITATPESGVSGQPATFKVTR